MPKRHRGITPEQAQIIQLRESGASWSKIAAQMGLRRDACCVLYGRAQEELVRRAALEKVVSDYRDEGRRSVYAKHRKRAERELEKAKSLDGVPIQHKQPPAKPVETKPDPLPATEPGPEKPFVFYDRVSRDYFEADGQGKPGQWTMIVERDGRIYDYVSMTELAVKVLPPPKPAPAPALSPARLQQPVEPHVELAELAFRASSARDRERRMGVSDAEEPRKPRHQPYCSFQCGGGCCCGGGLR